LPTVVAINKLRRGTLLPDGFKTAPAEIEILKPTDKNGWFRVTLFEGHNQQIRKMFDSVGHSVVKLKRISIGHIKDDWLKVGEFRRLSAEEIKAFKNPPRPPKPKTFTPRAKPKPRNVKDEGNRKFEIERAQKPKR